MNLGKTQELKKRYVWSYVVVKKSSSSLAPYLNLQQIKTFFNFKDVDLIAVNNVLKKTGITFVLSSSDETSTRNRQSKIWKLFLVSESENFN